MILSTRYTTVAYTGYLVHVYLSSILHSISIPIYQASLPVLLYIVSGRPGSLLGALLLIVLLILLEWVLESNPAVVILDPEFICEDKKGINCR